MKKPRGRYHHGSLHDAALEAVARELDEHGHLGLTLERVARRLGVTPSALYRHFENREALLRAFIWKGFLEFVARMDDAVRREAEPKRIVVAALRTYVEVSLENPGWFRLQFSRVGASMSERHQEQDLAYPAALQGAIGALARTDDQERIHDLYLLGWSVAHGLAGLGVEHVLGYLTTDLERLALAERLLGEFADALGALAPAPPEPRPAKARAKRRR